MIGLCPRYASSIHGMSFTVGDTSMTLSQFTLRQSFAGAVTSLALISVAQAADLQPVLKAPAAIDQQATGYVEVYSGWAGTRVTETECFKGCDSDRFRLNGWALGGAGRGNYWITRGVSVQVDAQ